MVNEEKQQRNIGFIILRVTVSIIIASHGWHRLIDGGSAPFGDWLASQGIPLGFGLAWFITGFEIIASPFLAFGKKIAYLCPVYIAIYFGGLVMVHLQHGWFVVGSGSNGIEFSTLLIAALICIVLPDYQQRFKRRF
jgi:putative oxidoreductase